MPKAEVPNTRPSPNGLKIVDAVQRSTTFFIATLMLFLYQTSPVSKHVNPACMSKTRAVQVSIQVNGLNEELVGMISIQKCHVPHERQIWRYEDRIGFH